MKDFALIFAIRTGKIIYILPAAEEKGDFHV